MGRLPHAAGALQYPGRHEGPPELRPEGQEREEDRTVGVDPGDAQERQEEQPLRVVPGLGEHQQLEREPHQREVETAVGRHDAGDAHRQQQDDGHDAPATGAEGACIGGAGQQAGPAEHDRVHRVGGVPEGPEQRGERQLRSPFVGDPAAVRLGVAEGVESDDGVVRQHPLPRGELPEFVVGQLVAQRDGGDEADAERQSDELDRPLRYLAGRGRRPLRVGSRSGGVGRRHAACLDGPDARQHCSPLVPVPQPALACTVQRAPAGRRRRTVAIASLLSAAPR